MPVIPWKVRRRNKELVQQSSRKNRRLRVRLRTVKLETLKKVYRILGESESTREARGEVMRLIRDAARSDGDGEGG